MLKQSVLWIGLLLCGYALWRIRDLAEAAVSRISTIEWIEISLLLIASWCLSVAAWREYLFAYTGEHPQWSTSIRQIGLLLVGKYVPGGVFGFLARVYDQSMSARRQLFWAGLAEQAVSAGLTGTLGGVLYICAIRKNIAWLCLSIVLPVLSAFGILLLHRISKLLPLLNKYAAYETPTWYRLLPAVVMQFAQILMWATVVLALADKLYRANIFASVGLAGSFLLAVAAGLLAVLVPGGVGVREAVIIGLASRWIDPAHAILLAILLRLLNGVLDVFAGGVAAFVGVVGRSK